MEFCLVTGIFTAVTKTGVGQGGTINLRAGSLSIIDDAAIAADTNGQGRGGNINLDVEDTLLLNGGTTAQLENRAALPWGCSPTETPLAATFTSMRVL